MKIPAAYTADADAMPEALRRLLDAELTAGNEILEVFHCFPAPPAGACFRMARPITTRPRASGAGIDFYDRNSSLYSGEFTDAKRFYFLIEPPNPPPPEPDMDAIRAARNPKVEMPQPSAFKKRKKRNPTAAESYPEREVRPLTPVITKADTAVEKFRESMFVTYERWHEGMGYDLQLLKTATPEEAAEIEKLLLSQGVSDWRDVEALAALNTPRARALLRKALKSRTSQISTAVIRYAPDLISDGERIQTLVAALETSKVYEGLTQTLLEVESFHPAKIVAALHKGVLARDGGTAMHFAAMLMFIHGKADSPFDWKQRPFFLKFNTEEKTEREAAYRELCEKLGPRARTVHRQR